MEIDPYMKLSFSLGKILYAPGITYYSYDLKDWNLHAGREYEIFGIVGYSGVGFGAYYVPKQRSTKSDPNGSSYWIEALYISDVLGAEWGLIFGYGTYSSRELPEPKKNPMGNVVLSIERSVTGNISVGWYYSIPFKSDLENSIWISCSLSY